MAPPPIRLLHHHLLLLPLHKHQPKRRNRKQYNIDNPKRERRLEHRTLLIQVEIEAVVAADPIRAQGDVDAAVGGEGRAVGVADAAQVVHAGDQRADEADVDEGDEVRGAACGFAPDQGEQAPCYGEGADYEEDSVGGALVKERGIGGAGG